MRIVKGDKVKYLDSEGVVISNPYMYITDMETYIDVYFSDIKEIMTIQINKSAFLGFIVLMIGLSLFFGFVLDVDVSTTIHMILYLVIISLGCYLMAGGL